MRPIESELMAIVGVIRDAIQQGLRTEEIVARLADPSGVARDMLDRAVARREAAAEYLMAEAEEPAKPSKRRRKPRVAIRTLDE